MAGFSRSSGMMPVVFVLCDEKDTMHVALYSQLTACNAAAFVVKERCYERDVHGDIGNTAFTGCI